MRSVISFCAILVALALLGGSANGQPSVVLTILNPPAPGTFLNTVSVDVSWQLSGGDYDPANDYISSWWSPFAATYLEYANITSDQGTQTFQLLNGRHDIFFRYYRGDQMLAQSGSITPEASYPMQIHVQFVQDHPDQAVVIWNTNRTSGAETVFYGTNPGSLGNYVSANMSTTYTHDQLQTIVGIAPNPVRTTQFQNLGARDLRCGFGTCYNDTTATSLYVDPGQFHFAVLTGLSPNTKYYFQCGEDTGYMSVVRSFHSRVAVGASSTLQALYVADAGVGRMYEGFSGSASHNSIPSKYGDAEGARHVWDAIMRDPLHAQDQTTIMNGDISYARGWPWLWELFHNETEEIFTSAPVMAVYGNHEFDYEQNPFSLCANQDSGGEAGIPTATRFGFKSHHESWFHMSNGPVHFIGLSSEQSVTEQAAWLADVLPTIDRTATPWLIVFQHRPIHESNTWTDKELAALMENEYSDMFSRYGVDMVLTGHAHYYERMCAINSGSCATPGVRPDWTRYANQTISTTNCVTKGSRGWKMNIDTCKATCLAQSDCNGAYLDGKTCMTIQCPLPLSLQPASDTTVFSLQRKSGQPPIYVVDGTAGGAHTPTSTPSSPLTEYKDFNKWGYSRIFATGTSLTWTHYHIDGSVVDTVTLNTPNGPQMLKEAIVEEAKDATLISNVLRRD